MTARTIVYIGDSITDGERNTTADGLGEGYVRELATRPELAGWTVVNSGISGNRISDIRGRWQQDVLAHSPDVVSVFVGINEVWRRFDSGDGTSDDDFAADYRAVLDTLDGVQIVLIEPFLLPKDADQAGWADELDGKRRVVGALAEAYGAVLVPAHDLLTAAGDATTHAPDGVHPNDAGHTLLADAWLDRAAALLQES